uniref:host RNA manipulator TomO n=1 Tax=Wolbachia endosymbiont (group A) of Volucella inflata TaxID=2954065 RepID=UPI002227A488|nr:hypothetical protein [Wolbachia endosymbiont (group A) of Volucella inflata]
MAIAANDKLTERYQDILFIEENLSLLPLLVGGQEYVKAFIGRFHDTDGIYDKLKDQSIQLGQSNKIGFFSVIALRKEQELLNAVFVEYVLRDFGQVLKTSKPDPLYGVLETASLIKNEEFITIVLDAFEGYINELTKKASTEELLKKSFATLLETAISQEHISVVEYLCKRYTNSTDHAIYGVYEQAFADDKVITILRQQILKNIGARGRKEIYDLILKTALDAGNIAFIEHLCEKCAECSNNVINYLDHKLKNNEFDNTCKSTLVALSNVKNTNTDVIVEVLFYTKEIHQNASHNEQVIRQVIQNILKNATHYSIGQEDCSLVKEVCYLYTEEGAINVIFQEECKIFKSSIEKRIEDLEKENKLLQSEALREYNYSYLPGIVNGLAQTAYIAYDEYTKDPKDNKRQKNIDLIFSLMQIRNILQFSIDVQEYPCHKRQDLWDEMYQTPGTFIIRKGSNNVADELEIPVITSDILSENPGLEKSGSQQPQENVDRRENIMNNEEASIEEAIGNDYRRNKMDRKGKQKNKKNGAQINGKQPSDLSNTVPPFQLTTPETPNASSSENSFQLEGDQDTQPLLLQNSVSDEDVTGDSDDKRGDSPSGSGSSSPIQDIVNEEELVVITTRQPNDSEHDKTVFKEHQGDAAIQNTQPKTLVVDSKPSNTGVESDEKKQASVQPTEHVPEESAGLKAQPSNTQEQQEVSETPVPEQTDDIESLSTQDALVLQSGSLNPITEMGNTQNLQSAVLSSQQLAFRNVIEIFNKHGREGFTSLKLVVQEFLRNGISEIQLPISNGYITLNLNTINKAGSEGLQNIVKVLTDSYKNGALNDRTRNAIETHDDIDDYRLFSEKDPTLTPTPVPTPNPILTSIPGQVPTSVPPVTSESSATLNSPQPSVANNKSEQVNDAQTTTKQLEEPISPSVPPTVHVSQNNIHVQPSNSTPTATATRSSIPTTQVVPKNVPAAPVPPVTSESSGQADNVQINGKQSTNPSNIANASSDVNSKPITKEPVVTESNQQNSLPPLSSFDLSSPQRFVDDKVSSITGVLRSEVSIEDNTSSLDITDDEYSEDSSVVSEDSLIEDVTDEKEPLLDKTNKGDSTLKSSNSPQSTKSSKLPTVVTWTLAVAGVLAGVATPVAYFAFGASLLVAGITAGVGACCLVAATIIYYCTPKSQVENNEVEKSFNTGKVPTAVHV